MIAATLLIIIAGCCCTFLCGMNFGRQQERARIRARIITDQATSSADYSEAEEYADKMVQS